MEVWINKINWGQLGGAIEDFYVMKSSYNKLLEKRNEKKGGG